MGEIQIDSLASCGIVRIDNTVGNDYEFKCLVPNDVKEEDVSAYITGILLSMKDKVQARKSWRFKEKAQKSKKVAEQNKPKILKKSGNKKNYDKPFGTSVQDKLKEAGIE